MKNKKIILLSIIGLLIIVFFSLYNSLNFTYYERGHVGDKNNYINTILKEKVPKNIRRFVRDTIFVFKKVPILEQSLEDEKIENKQLKTILSYLGAELLKSEQFNIELEEIARCVQKRGGEFGLPKKSATSCVKEEIDAYIEFEFKKNKTINQKLHNINLSLKTFTSPILKLTGPRSYLSYYNQNLFLITGTGILMYTSLDNLKNEKFVFKRIDNNFENIVGLDHIKNKTLVKNLLIKNNKIYVSYVKKVKDKCFTSEILVSSLKFEKIIFNKFFNINECQPEYTNGTGGNLSEFKDNKILMAIGGYRSYSNQGNNNPQNINSFMGKIISISEKTKEYRILSMGLRNPQGLYYDKKNNVIYSTDHGPQGGDEINVNTSPDGEIKNYGWGISSYGEHYKFPHRINPKLYKLAPLNKSHAKYGFIEPLKYFTPAIAPTQIIKTEKFIKIPNKNIIYVGTLGYDVEEGDLSIHQLILDADLKIEQHNIIPVYERVRDMVYIEELNKIFLFLESSGSIGILEVDN